jgi:4-azaleucine resistance transporter AzlC
MRWSRRNFFAVFKLTLPVLSGYVTLGMAFGLMVVTTGYPFWVAPFVSIVLFAGASQFLAIGLCAAGASITSIVMSVFVLNLRHAVYGLSLLEPFRRSGKWRPYLIFALSDETFALMTGCPDPETLAPRMKAGTFSGAIALLDQSYWVLGTIIGAAAGALIPVDFTGVEFALTALFAVMLLDQLKRLFSHLEKNSE